MATFSKKMMGKEVGDATVYAKPHTMGTNPVDGDIEKILHKEFVKNSSGKDDERDVTPSGNMSTNRYNTVKTTGIKIRGTGAATKGVMARGPMA